MNINLKIFEFNYLPCNCNRIFGANFDTFKTTTTERAPNRRDSPILRIVFVFLLFSVPIVSCIMKTAKTLRKNNKSYFLIKDKKYLFYNSMA